jgi:hypothetical protein
LAISARKKRIERKIVVVALRFKAYIFITGGRA